MGDAEVTLDEANKIAAVIGTADSACSNCVGSLVEKMNVNFPQFVWKATDQYVREYFKYDGIPATEDDSDYSSSRVEVLVRERA